MQVLTLIVKTEKTADSSLEAAVRGALIALPRELEKAYAYGAQVTANRTQPGLLSAHFDDPKNVMSLANLTIEGYSADHDRRYVPQQRSISAIEAALPGFQYVVRLVNSGEQKLFSNDVPLEIVASYIATELPVRIHKQMTGGSKPLWQKWPVRLWRHLSRYRESVQIVTAGDLQADPKQVYGLLVHAKITPHGVTLES